MLFLLWPSFLRQELLLAVPRRKRMPLRSPRCQPPSITTQGLWCRLWQAGVVALGVTVLMLLRSRGAHKAMLPTNSSFSRPRQLSVGSFGSFGALPKMH